MLSRTTPRLVAQACLSLAIAAAVIGAPSTSSAEPRRKRPAAARTAATPNKTQAAELFKKGADAYLHGDFAGAIKLLDEAYALDPQPVLVYNMARAHEGLGHVDEAIALYERYLAEDPASTDRGAIEQRLATLREQREERGRLEKEKAALAASRAAQQAEKDRLEERAREMRATPPEEPPKRSSVPYVVAGVGAAGLAAGTVFGLLALGKEDAGRSAVSLLDATEARDDGKTFATVANVSFIGGGALLAGGLLWWLLDRSSARASEPAAAARRAPVRAGASPGAFFVAGTF
jgi:tetratricopeptide (TPR) repeat protein